MKLLLRTPLILIGLAGAMFALVGCASVQRKLLYFPSHLPLATELTPWLHNGETIGYAREVKEPEAVWLMLHGNGGQAAHRASALSCFSPRDSVFVLEYPGYGNRSGKPSLTAINEAARTAYALLRARFPSRPLCVVGESLGTGPACFLATSPTPPEKLVLIVPYDELARVAKEHYPFLPVRLIMRDNWNNLQSLARYNGPLEIFAERFDTVIPIAHAQTLAASKPQSVFHELIGGHNDWTRDPAVVIRYAR
ncbi:MAG: hypothetical protein QM790_21105 [Nibricoccus sp.]